MSTGFKISTPAIIAVLVCFFVPWLAVSCGGAEITMSGYDLAAGVPDGSGGRTEGEAIFWVVLAAAIACLGLALLIYFNTLPRFTAILLQVLLSGTSLVIIIVKWSGYRAQEAGVLIEPRFGLWGTIVGLVGVIAGGVIDLLSSERSGRPGPGRVSGPGPRPRSRTVPPPPVRRR